MDVRMEALRWIRRPSEDSPSRRVAGFLGSFDPPHFGHLWIMQHLLRTHDRVILLLPSHHLHKRIVPPLNATLQQRAQMLALLREIRPGRLGIAISSEVLYLRLADCLQREFPSSEIGFGMGDESRSKLAASSHWFARAGLSWGDEQQRSLQELFPRVVVFGRTSLQAGNVELPSSIRRLSSSVVRERVASLRSKGAEWVSWTAELQRMVPQPIARFVYEAGLYPASA